jgi:hypothetical protein
MTYRKYVFTLRKDIDGKYKNGNKRLTGNK